MKRISNVIAIMSSKGGVGKTSITANLAAALATEFNKKILIIDTNISTASLGLHLNIFYPKFAINDILQKDFPIKKAIHFYNDNLHVIPANIQIRKPERNIHNLRKNVFKIIEKYKEILTELSEEYDLILLDCAPGFEMESIAAMHVAGGLLLVINPEYPALVSATKTVEYAKILKMPVGGAILNKSLGKKYELKKEDIEGALGIKIIGAVPFDKKVPESIANKMPIVLFDPYSKSSIVFKKLAASIVGMEYKFDLAKRVKKVLRIGKKKYRKQHAKKKNSKKSKK